MPLEPLRAELARICEAAPQWDKRVCTVQATDSNERAVRVRFLISAADSGLAFELRCIVREQMLAFITAHYPHGLPRLRSTHASPQLPMTAPCRRKISLARCDFQLQCRNSDKSMKTRCMEAG